MGSYIDERREPYHRALLTSALPSYVIEECCNIRFDSHFRFYVDCPTFPT